MLDSTFIGFCGFLVVAYHVTKDCIVLIHVMVINNVNLIDQNQDKTIQDHKIGLEKHSNREAVYINIKDLNFRNLMVGENN